MKILRQTSCISILFLGSLLSACTNIPETDEHPVIRDFQQQMDKSIAIMSRSHAEASKLLATRSGGNYAKALKPMQVFDQQTTRVLHLTWQLLDKLDYDSSPWTSSPAPRDWEKNNPQLKRFKVCEDYAQTIGALMESEGALLQYVGKPAGKQEQKDFLPVILEHDKQILQASRDAKQACSQLPVERLRKP